MSIRLIKAVSLSVPAFLLLWYFLVLFKRGLPWSALQLVGAAALMITVLTHVREAPALFPWMGWEAESSPGHYLDLSGAILGLTLFPTG